MPLQDKNRPDRKVIRRKVISNTGRIFECAQDFAEEYDIAVQTAYNIIRRKQVFHGMTFRYMDSSEQTGRTEQTKSETEQTNTDRNETDVHKHD